MLQCFAVHSDSFLLLRVLCDDLRWGVDASLSSVEGLRIHGPIIHPNVHLTLLIIFLFFSFFLAHIPFLFTRVNISWQHLADVGFMQEDQLKYNKDQKDLFWTCDPVYKGDEIPCVSNETYGSALVGFGSAVEICTGITPQASYLSLTFISSSP